MLLLLHLKSHFQIWGPLDILPHCLLVLIFNLKILYNLYTIGESRVVNLWFTSLILHNFDGCTTFLICAVFPYSEKSWYICWKWMHAFLYQIKSVHFCESFREFPESVAAQLLFLGREESEPAMELWRWSLYTSKVMPIIISDLPKTSLYKRGTYSTWFNGWQLQWINGWRLPQGRAQTSSISRDGGRKGPSSLRYVWERKETKLHRSSPLASCNVHLWREQGRYKQWKNYPWEVCVYLWKCGCIIKHSFFNGTL